MQTFSDFINQRFGIKEEIDQNQQRVPEKMQKKARGLEEIIHAILDNPNYFDDFFKKVKEFVEEVRDNDLFNMIENLKNQIENDKKDKGLGLISGILDKPNNLPPNMGG